MKENNTKINNLCTILIPTYNRPKYLKRILGYYNGFEENYNIVIADSSLNNNKEINKKNILLFSNLDIIYLDHYSSKINPLHKFADMVNYVEKKYCVFCADDDFIIPNGINQSVTFLEKNSDFSVAQGRFIGFSIKNSKNKGLKQFHWAPLYTNKSTIFSDPKDRMYEHLSNYNLPTIYAVHRTDLLKMIFEDTVEYTNDGKFGELLPSMLDLIYGKMKKLDVIYSARESIIGSGGQAGKSLEDFIKNGTYEKKYTKFKNCLAKHLIKNSQMNGYEAKELIDKAMSVYLGRPYSKNYKGILIGKMINLLNALNLPESIDKNIRTLYKKIFTPEINDLKNTIESPNSKYFDDFNTIRNHVLLYAKLLPK